MRTRICDQAQWPDCLACYSYVNWSAKFDCFILMLVSAYERFEQRGGRIDRARGGKKRRVKDAAGRARSSCCSEVVTRGGDAVAPSDNTESLVFDDNLTMRTWDAQSEVA